jgi:predicted RND superfamily exporter protein
LVSALGQVTGWVEAHPRLVVVASAAVFAFAAAGHLRLEVETDFSRNFRANTPIVQSLEFVETRLGGAGTWEVNFAVPAEMDDACFERVDALAGELRRMAADSDGRFTKVVSLADGLKLVPRFPVFLNTIRKRLNALQNFQPEFEQSLYNPAAGRMRIILRARERQASHAKLQLMADVERTALERFPQAKATGTFVLLAHLIESLLRDQLISFAIAAAGIVAMMTVAFRSLRIGIASLVPNLFPIVLVIGGMGWIGLPVNIGTAMIASVSMGLTVDSSIHYISGYRRARNAGQSTAEAIRTTNQSVGLALVFANIALVIGFTVLTLSRFVPLIYFGILVSLAMLGGLSGNLILLPLLLRWLDRGDVDEVRSASKAQTATAPSSSQGDAAS